MRIAIEDLPCACLVTDRQGTILQANVRLADLAGHPLSALTERNLDTLLSPGTQMFFQTHVWPMLRKCGEVREVYFHLQSRENVRIPLYLNAQAQADAQALSQVQAQAHGAPYIWMFFSWEQRSQFEAELVAARRQAQAVAAQVRDAHAQLHAMHLRLQEQVTDTEARFQTASDMAYKDSLTQVGNRRSLQVAASMLVANAAASQKFSVLMIDVDHFKSVNDRYGHDRGDEVLQRVAQCIQRTARHGDTVVRYGGEEFSLVLPGADEPQAMRVAARIHQEIREQQLGEVSITVSIGAATADVARDDLFRVLKLADEALYRAKRGGRNCSVHHQAGQPKVVPYERTK